MYPSSSSSGSAWNTLETSDEACAFWFLWGLFVFLVIKSVTSLGVENHSLQSVYRG